MIKVRTKAEYWALDVKDVPETKEDYYQYIVVRREKYDYWYQDEKGRFFITYKSRSIESYLQYSLLPDDFKEWLGSYGVRFKND